MGVGGDRLHDWILGLRSWRAAHGHEGGTSSHESDRFGKAFASLGSVIMGHTMFENGLEPWGERPPFGCDVYVLTHRARDPLKKANTTFHFIDGGVEAALERARESAGEKNVQVAGGGIAISQFIAAGLLDEIEVHTVPVLFGNGVPLFSKLGDAQIELEPIEVFVGETGVVHSKYRIAR